MNVKEQCAVPLLILYTYACGGLLARVHTPNSLTEDDYSKCVVWQGESCVSPIPPYSAQCMVDIVGCVL